VNNIPKKGRRRSKKNRKNKATRKIKLIMFEHDTED